jgi:hypothetical protein
MDRVAEVKVRAIPLTPTVEVVTLLLTMEVIVEVMMAVVVIPRNKKMAALLPQTLMTMIQDV